MDIGSERKQTDEEIAKEFFDKTAKTVTWYSVCNLDRIEKMRDNQINNIRALEKKLGNEFGSPPVKIAYQILKKITANSEN